MHKKYSGKIRNKARNVKDCYQFSEPKVSEDWKYNLESSCELLFSDPCCLWWKETGNKKDVKN